MLFWVESASTVNRCVCVFKSCVCDQSEPFNGERMKLRSGKALCVKCFMTFLKVQPWQYSRQFYRRTLNDLLVKMVERITKKFGVPIFFFIAVFIQDENCKRDSTEESL